jgi:hypothetical protein
MDPYLLIESQSSFEFRDCENFFQLAVDLSTAGHKVVYYLVENGVFSARKSTQSVYIEKLVAAGIEVLADKFSLQERGVLSGSLVDGVQNGQPDQVIEYMIHPYKVIWH